LQHTSDCLSEFKKAYGTQEYLNRLFEYALQINNGALFKKPGFLAEKLNLEASFADACAKHLTTGYAYLDKKARTNKLVTKWRL